MRGPVERVYEWKLRGDEMTDDSRKAFEAAMREQLHWTDSLFTWTVSNYGNYYAIGGTHTAFQGWSARDAEVAALKARVEELAGMMGGMEITATTRKHASEMLARA